MNDRRQTVATIDSFIEFFSPTSRSTNIDPEDDLYGFLVGSWELDLVAYPDEGNVTHSTGEAHFAWVLDGRAIQECLSIHNGQTAPTRQNLATGMAQHLGISIQRSAPGACSGSIPTTAFAPN